MKLLITAGGGGHFAPALSVIQELPNTTEVLFIGRKYSIEKDKTTSFEYHMAKKLGIPFYPLETGKLQRNFSKKSLQSLLKIPSGLFQALRVLREFKPDAVLSFGGYVALPVTVAAHILHIPVVIHEQTMIAGLANKIASTFAKTVCISWDASRKYFPKEKVVLTGNPLRKEILETNKHNSIPEIEHIEKPLIYITGGSMGSHKINLMIEEALPTLLASYTVFHQTGDAKEFSDYDRLSTLQKSLPNGTRYIVRKFLEPRDVASVFQKASLVIGRSGANTMIEILYFGKPAILIPINVGQKNEQETNARFLKKIGLAEIINENITGEELTTLIDEMFGTIKKYAAAAKIAKEFVPEDSGKRIINEVSKAISEKSES